MARPTLLTLPPSDDPTLLRSEKDTPVQLSYSYWPPTAADVHIAPVVVFLPAEGTDSRSIHREQLESPGLRCRFNLIALDLRGCGYSVHPVPSVDAVKDIDLQNVLAQDVIDALPSLPGRPLEPGPNGESRLFFVGTSVNCFIAMRIAAKLGDLARGLILISPSSEVESSDNAESFTDMVEAWAMTNQELVNQFPDSDTLLRVSPSVKVPLLVSGGFHARLLNEQPWPAKLFSVLTNHWRRRWLSAQDAHMDLEIWVHLPCSKRRELGTQWAGITSHVLVVRGGEGQPNGNGMEEHLRAKLVNAASFTCHVVDEAPLLVSVTHAASVNNEMAKFCARVCGLDTPELEPADNGSANDSLSPSITQATASPPSRSGSPSSLHESVHLDGGVHRSRAESVCSGVSSNSRSSGLTPTTTQALRNIMDFNMWKDLNRSQNSWTTGDTSCSSGDIRGRTTSCVTASALAVSPDVRSRATSDASSFFAQPDGVPRSRGMTDLHENEVLVMAAGQPEPGYKGMSASTDLAPQALCPVEPPYDSPTSQAEGSDAQSEGDDSTDAEDDVSIERGALLRRSFGRLSTKPCVLLFPSEYDGENFKTGETNAECAAQDYAMNANAAARMSIVIDEEVVAYTSY